MGHTSSPKDTFLRDGTASLYRFRRPEDGSVEAGAGAPVLLVPSLINRWYVLDLRPGASLVAALVGEGVDTWCLDWGVPEDEDRYLTWTDVLARLARAVRAVKRATGTERVSLLGYCMGGTLAGIHTALHPEEIAGLVNLAGPYDFAAAGILGTFVDPRWFDAAAIAAAGNVTPGQMQSGFSALRPTLPLAKWVSQVDRAADPAAREAFRSVEEWASDNVPFPGAAYETYISELYQKNALVNGTHRVGGRSVDLGEIRCPVLTIVAERDAICPPAAATALNERCGATEREVLSVSGGHVGAVVGGRASAVLYPAITSWLSRHQQAGTADARSRS